MTTYIAEQLLRAKQRKPDVTFTTLAAATGLARGTVELYLYGKRAPRVPDFLRLCAALGLDAGEVLDDAEGRFL